MSTSMVIAINSTVCIAPEALPSLNLLAFEYATVTKIDEERGRITFVVSVLVALGARKRSIRI